MWVVRKALVADHAKKVDAHDKDGSARGNHTQNPYAAYLHMPLTPTAPPIEAHEMKNN